MNGEFSIQDIVQWLAWAGLAGTLWYRLRQRDDRVAAEARHGAIIESRISALERRFEAHKRDDAEVLKRLIKIGDEIHEIRERLVKLESRLQNG